jgi:formylglycine-generating enzyme required for sulfatase activity
MRLAPSRLAGGLSNARQFVPVAFLTLAAACLAINPARAEVTIDWVTVGNPWNASDWTGYGAVNYDYRIGKYEVTIQQYADFLNAAAKSDPYSLYSGNMATGLNMAGISRAGSSGSYTYSVINNGGNSGNRPIAYVSWFDAARFANWMQNGQGSGSTETGAYTLNGVTSGTAPAKNPGAQFYIPTENEWYKAAYYSPNYGGSGVGGYYTYATQSNVAPGTTIGSSPNQANYDQPLGTATDVGSFSGSGSFYGTFDQSGNVYQWNDLNGTAGSSRGLRGGFWSDDSNFVSSSIGYGFGPSVEASSIGFRLASPV